MPLASPTIIADPARLAALRATGLLDSPPDAALDRLTRLTTRLLGVPVALVTLVDRDRQYFASAAGLTGELAERRETPLSHSFCQHVVAQARPLVVTDRREHPLLADLPQYPDQGIVAYAGMPLVTSDGRALGSFCAVDDVPRQWTEDELALLRDLAQAAMTEIELRHLTRALREQGEQLRDLLDHTGDLVCGFDARGAVVYVNRAWTRVLHATDEETALRGVSSMLAEESRPRWQDAWQRMLDGVPTDALELIFAPRGRPRVLVEARLTPRVVEFEVHGARLVCRDVTEQRRVARLKDEMIGIVSHELRSPIGAVKGALRLLEAHLPDTVGERERKLVDLAHRNSDRLLTLVNDLLDLERLEDGSLPLELVDLPLDAVGGVVRDTLALAAQEAGVTLRFALAGARVQADPQRLAQVLINLVGNAVKFTDSGEVVLRVRPSGEGGWIAEIVDTGPGIPEADIPRIFEPFRQAHEGLSRPHGGTGLGLAISRSLCELLGHRLEVESQAGRGSTFRVHLDATRGSADLRPAG